MDANAALPYPTKGASRAPSARPAYLMRERPRPGSGALPAAGSDPSEGSTWVRVRVRVRVP